MLVGIVCALSVLSAVLTCLGSGAFETLRWLWVLPVTAVGTFLGLALLWFLLMFVMSKLLKLYRQRLTTLKASKQQRNC